MAKKIAWFALSIVAVCGMIVWLVVEPPEHGFMDGRAILALACMVSVLLAHRSIEGEDDDV